MARFLDTNVILRYLTRDDEVKAQAALRLLLRAERGEERLATSPTSSSSMWSTLWGVATESAGSASGNFCFP